MNETNKKLNYFTAIKFLSKYILKYKKNFIKFYTGWLLDTVLSIVMPILFGIMIDEIVYYQNVNTFIRTSIVFVVMSLFSCILYVFIYAQHHYLMNMYTFNIRKDIFDHLQKCDAQYLADAKSGEIVSVIQPYVGECVHFVVRNVIHCANGIFSICLITFYLFNISWQIGLLILLAAPITVLINIKFAKKIRKYADDGKKYYGEYISWVFEMLSGICNIRMMGAEKKTHRRFIENHKKMFNVDVKSGVSTLTASNIVTFTNLCVRLAIFTFAGYLVLNDNITIGLLTVIIAFFGSLSSGIENLSYSYLDSQNRIATIQRIYDFMNSPTEDLWTGKNELKISKGDIQFSNIEFAYNGNSPVLNDFSLDIQSGERFALVGESGSGKTTLAYMLIGFYRPQGGEIIIDGQRLSNCTLKSIRQNIGIIQQDVLIFDNTIKENLLLGMRNAGDDNIISACKRAGIWEFISSLPDGLETIVGKKGIGLSGGQKQRIAIARIYLKNPKIIIFDEATSSLDYETEEKIHESWKSVLSGRTAIVIAHRQSSVMLCEKVAILENGEICEVGKPSELEQHSQNFRRLFALMEDRENV